MLFAVHLGRSAATARPIQLEPLKKEPSWPPRNTSSKDGWKQLKGEARRVWGKLTDDDWDRARAGNRDKLVGALQERYGWEKTQAESDFDHWVDSVSTSTRTPEEKP